MEITEIKMQEKEKLKAWIFEVVADGSWERYNDIHIDEISPIYKKKTRWIDGALNCYSIANEIINEAKLPFAIELAFHLKSRKKIGDYKVQNISDLKKSLDYTPPSLYLFGEKSQILTDSINKGESLKDFFKNVSGNFYYYQAFNVNDREIRRVAYLIN